VRTGSLNCFVLNRILRLRIVQMFTIITAKLNSWDENSLLAAAFIAPGAAHPSVRNPVVGGDGV